MKTETMDTSRMLEGLQNGSVQAFQAFYKDNLTLIYRIALKMLGDSMEAEDICHDVFLEAMDGIGKYDPERGSLQAWLAVKARSRCLDRIRRKNRLVLEMEGQAPAAVETAESVEDKVLARLDREKIHAAMERIPLTQRHALQGMYYESQTHKELSRSFSVPLGTVKSWVRYGIRNMRKQLTRDHWLDGSGGVGEHEA